MYKILRIFGNFHNDDEIPTDFWRCSNELCNIWVVLRKLSKSLDPYIHQSRRRGKPQEFCCSSSLGGGWGFFFFRMTSRGFCIPYGYECGQPRAGMEYLRGTHFIYYFDGPGTNMASPMWKCRNWSPSPAWMDPEKEAIRSREHKLPCLCLFSGTLEDH